MKKLYVRVQPKQGAERFFRCGIEFRQAWKEVEVDAATAARLEAEQMLEVLETKPAELENEAPNEADTSGASTAATGSDTPAAAPISGSNATQQDEGLEQKAETKSVGLEHEAPNADAPSGDSTTVADSETPAAVPVDGNNAPQQNEGLGGQAAPDDPAVRLEAIRAAIGQLNKEDASLWTTAGQAKTEAIATITGWPVSAAERDAATAKAGV